MIIIIIIIMDTFFLQGWIHCETLSDRVLAGSD